jgi:hypothetical protein
VEHAGEPAFAAEFGLQAAGALFQEQVEEFSRMGFAKRQRAQSFWGAFQGLAFNLSSNGHFLITFPVSAVSVYSLVPISVYRFLQSIEDSTSPNRGHSASVLQRHFANRSGRQR